MRVNYLGTVHSAQVGAALRGLALVERGCVVPVVQWEHPAVLQMRCGCVAPAQLLAPALPGRCPQAALSGMLERRQGRIVLVASTMAILGFAGEAGSGDASEQAWAVHSTRLLDCCTNVAALSTNIAWHGPRWHTALPCFRGHRCRWQSSSLSSAASPCCSQATRRMRPASGRCGGWLTACTTSCRAQGCTSAWPTRPTLVSICRWQGSMRGLAGCHAEQPLVTVGTGDSAPSGPWVGQSHTTTSCNSAHLACADTPGYATEMETKPAVCKAVNAALGSELFSADKARMWQLSGSAGAAAAATHGVPPCGCRWKLVTPLL